jgi:hypothetical protein
LGAAAASGEEAAFIAAGASPVSTVCAFMSSVTLPVAEALLFRGALGLRGFSMFI